MSLLIAMGIMLGSFVMSSHGQSIEDSVSTESDSLAGSLEEEYKKTDDIADELESDLEQLQKQIEERKKKAAKEDSVLDATRAEAEKNLPDSLAGVVEEEYKKTDDVVDELESDVEALEKQLKGYETEPSDESIETQAARGEPDSVRLKQLDSLMKAASRPKNLISELQVIGNDKLKDDLILNTITLRERDEYKRKNEKLSAERLEKLKLIYEKAFIKMPYDEDSLRLFVRISDKNGFWENPVDYLLYQGAELTAGQVSLSYHNVSYKEITIAGSYKWNWLRKMEGIVAISKPNLLSLPLMHTFYGFNRKETWDTGLFATNNLTVLHYGGGYNWYHLFNLWLEGSAGFSYSQRTFNRVVYTVSNSLLNLDDGNILNLWTRWLLTSMRSKDPERLQLWIDAGVQYNATHPMRLLQLKHNVKVEAEAGLEKLLSERFLIKDKVGGKLGFFTLPIDQLYAAGDSRFLRGHPPHAKLGRLALYNAAELHYLLKKHVSLVFFGDVGNIWWKAVNAHLLKLDVDAGFGFQFDFPVTGTIRFDWGKNLKKSEWYIYVTHTGPDETIN